MITLAKLNQSSSLADCLLEDDAAAVTHWTADDGRSALLFDYPQHQVVILPNPDGKRFDFVRKPKAED